MIVYHVTSFKKFTKYQKVGRIFAPVRAWEDIGQAARMSVSTGRKIILRLRFPDNAELLEGHFGKARVINNDLPLPVDLYAMQITRGHHGQRP